MHAKKTTNKGIKMCFKGNWKPVIKENTIVFETVVPTKHLYSTRGMI